jgi:peptidoglycan-associated lipoprotein
MLFRVFVLFAGLLLVSACAGDANQAASTSGEGSSMSASENIAMGSMQDFEVNVGSRVYFAFDSYALDSSAQQTLRAQAAWLQKYPDVTAVIEGHADERGTREYNLALGERRAKAVYDYLVSLGVPASRLSTVSYGKERPAVVGSNEAAWAQNRRAYTNVSAPSS